MLIQPEAGGQSRFKNMVRPWTEKFRATYLEDLVENYKDEGLQFDGNVMHGHHSVEEEEKPVRENSALNHKAFFEELDDEINSMND